MQKQKLNILLLEDTQSDVILIKRELNRNWTDYKIKITCDPGQMKQLLSETEFDVIISDYKMPAMTGLDALKFVRSTGNKIPFIMVSGTMGEKIAVEVMKAGANDYLLKENLHRLNPVLERVLKEFERRQDLEDTQEALAESYFISEAVIKDSPLGIVVRDSSLRLLHCNKSWQRIWDFSDEEVEKQRYYSGDDPDSFYDYAGEYRKLIKEVYNEGKELIIPELRLTGEKKKRAEWISQHFYALKTQAGNVGKIVSITNDITLRKQEEIQSELKNAILEQLNQICSWEQKLYKILEILRDGFGYSGLAFRLKKGEKYPLYTSLGFNQDFLQSQKLQQDNIDEGQKQKNCQISLYGELQKRQISDTGLKFNEFGSLIINELQKLKKTSSPSLLELLDNRICLEIGYESLALIPLKSEQKILGLLQINDFTENRFKNDEILFLEEICRITGISLQRKEAEEEIIRNRINLDALINNTKDMIWSIDRKYRLLTINVPFQKSINPLFGRELYAGDLLLDKDILPESMYENWKSKYDKVLEGKREREELNIVTHLNTTLFLEIHYNPIYEEGKVTGVSVFARDISSRKKTEKLLKESEKNFREIIESSRDIHYRQDYHSGNLEYMSPSCREILGYSGEEINSMSLKEQEVFYHPEDLKKLRSFRKDLREHDEAGHRYYERRFRIISRDGKIKHIKGVYTLLRDDKGEPAYINGLLQDITEQLEAERALKQSEENFRSFFNNIHEYLFILDGEGNFLELNKMCLDRLGYEREELIGKPVRKVFSSESEKNLWGKVAQMLSGKEDFYPFPLVSKDGQEIKVETYLSQGVWNEHPALLGSSKDITALRESEQKFSTAFHSSPLIMEISEIESGEYIEVNRTFCEKFGYSAAEVKGKKATEILKLDNEFRQKMYNELITKGKIRNLEGIVFNRKGEKLILLFSAVLLDFNQRRVIFSSAIDITERKKAENELRKLNSELKKMHEELEMKVDATVNELRQRDLLVIQQSRQAGQIDMLSHIAHHWRQPLNAIGLIIQSIQDAFEFEELDQKFLNSRVEDAMERLTMLSGSIDNFRELYGGNQEIEIFEAGKYISDIVNLMKQRFRSNNIEFIVSLEGFGQIKGIASDYAQALINILDNAYEIHQNRHVDKPWVKIRSHCENGELLVKISNNAGGIKPEIRETLFELYVSGKESLNNTGIGLYMSKSIIENHMGGKIELIEQNDEVEFRIIVPLIES